MALIYVICFVSEKETVPTGTSKGDLLKARNLTRYIKQVNILSTFFVANEYT